MENPSEKYIKVVKSEEVKLQVDEPTINNKELPLSHEELMSQISTKGTIFEREQCVVENLKRMGF